MLLGWSADATTFARASTARTWHTSRHRSVTRKAERPRRIKLDVVTANGLQLVSMPIRVR